MIEQQVPAAKCLSDLTLISAWCTNEITDDMCVADPTIEQPSDSMESCTRENNDSPAIPDLKPPSSPSDGACNEIKISEVFTLEQDSPGEDEDTPLDEDTQMEEDTPVEDEDKLLEDELDDTPEEEEDTPIEEEDTLLREDTPVQEVDVIPDDDDDEADVSVMIVEDETEAEEAETDKPDVDEVKEEEQHTEESPNTFMIVQDENVPEEIKAYTPEASEEKEEEDRTGESSNSFMIVEDETVPEEIKRYTPDVTQVSEEKEEEKHTEESSNTVMIVEDETVPEEIERYTPETSEDLEATEEGSTDVQIITITDDKHETSVEDAEIATELAITDVKSETEKVSAEVISEIDKEILRSLQGTFKNLKTIISGIKGEGRGRGRGRGKKRPDSEPSFGTSTSGAKSKPLKEIKLGTGKDTKHTFGSGDSNAKGDNTDKSNYKWNVERFENILKNEPASVGRPGGVKRKRSSAEAKVNVPETKPKVHVPETQPKEDKHEEDVVWICFVCAKEFCNQQALMTHQDTCEEDSPDLDDPVDPVDPVEPSHSPPLTIEQISHLPVTIEYDPPSEIQGVPIIRQISETETVSFTSPLKKDPGFPSVETDQPVPALLTKVGSGIKSLPLGLPRRRRIPKRKFKDIYIPPPRDTYFACMGLGPTPSVEEQFKSPRKSVNEDDCAIIDLTVEEATAQLASPMTPRSRSLISQLSRDETGRRRQLSFSASTPSKPETIPAEKTEVILSCKTVDSDSESSESSEEESVKRKSAPFKSALLGIDLTSPLGQRLKKHWQNENKVPVISDVEAFCKNYSLRDIYKEELDRKKTPVMEKLRHRPPPQVTFKFTKKYLNKWFHKYKFNSLDRREFDKILWTGLERESRIRSKRMKPCKVVMQRLTKKDIKFWTTPRVRKQDFRSLQCFRNLGPNAPRFRPRLQGVRALLNRPLQQRMLMINQMNRARLSAPMLQHGGATSLLRFRPGRMPTPQYLVRPHDGINGMRLQVMNIHPNMNAYQTMQQPLLRAQLLDPGAQLIDKRVQKRKQAFVNVRNDDNLVICLSSDEEEDVKKGSDSTQSGSASPSATKLVSLLPTTTQGGNSTKSTGATDSASSRVFGGSFVQNQSSSSPVPVSAIPVKVPSDREFTSVRVMNGQMYLQQPTQTSTSTTATPAVRSQTATSQNSGEEESTSAESDVKDIVPAGSPVPSAAVDSPRNARSQSQSDSEYMDFEVICIESDEED